MAWLRETRQALHQIPELGFDLFKTQAYLIEALEAMGYEPHTVARTGVYVYIPGTSQDTIAFRADMDGLPVHEKTSLPFASKHVGAMHACGHDGHMSMLLGLAKKLVGQTLNQSVLLLFQPAEEGPRGAKDIVQSGLLSRYQVSKIYGFHLFPGLKEGSLGLLSGPMMAQNGEFDVFIEGRSAHGAQPHLGHDAISAGVALAQALNMLTAKMIDPLVPTVIVLGTFHAGEARNVLAGEARLTGTIRTFDPVVYTTLKSKIMNIVEGLSQAYEVKMTLDIRDFYPPVINDETLTKHAQDALPKDKQVPIKPLMLAEDFAFYQQVIPGLFMLLGTRTNESYTQHDLHSAYFNFNEDVLVEGVNTYITLLKAHGVLTSSTQL